MSSFVVPLSVALAAGGLAVVLSDRVIVPRSAALIAAGIGVSFLNFSESLFLLLGQLSGLFVVFSAASRTLPTGPLGDTVSDGVTSAALRTVVLWVAGAGAGALLGLGNLESLFLGFAAAATSTAEAVGLVERKAERNLVHAKLAEAASATEDVVAVCFAGFLASEFLGAGAGLLAASLGLLLRGEVAKFLRRYELSEQFKVFLAAAVLLGASYATSMAFAGPLAGALAAGYLVSSYPADVELLDSLEPLEDFFASVFFVSLGALTAMTLFSAGVGLALAGTVSLLGPALTFVALRLVGRDLHQSTLTSLELGSVSEIVLVAALLFRDRIPVVFDAVVFAGLVSATVSYVLYSRSGVIYDALEAKISEGELQKIERSDHTVLIGYGRLGRKLAQVFEDPVVVEHDPGKLEDAAEFATVFGNARNQRVLEAASVEEAERLVSTPESDLLARRLSEIELEADLHLVTASEDVAESIDASTAATVPELSRHRALDNLEEGFSESFEKLKAGLEEEISGPGD